MSAQHSAGIQTLLDAEREASKIVEQARGYRTKRVRAARDEAKKEIEQHRQNMEKKYKDFEAQHTKGNQAAEQEAMKEADSQIKALLVAVQKNQPKVVNELLKAVFDVELVPPSAA